jgi:hypothetical protein
MRFLIHATVVGLAAVLASGTALAQQPETLRYANDYDYYADDYYVMQDDAPSPSPSDVVPSTPSDEGTDDVEAGCGLGCEPACGGCCMPGCCRGGGLARCCNLGDPWELPVPCRLRCMGIEWGGWISHGYYTNAHGADDNGPVAFRDVGNEYTLNQLWFYAERALDTENRGGIDWGFRVDYVFGADGPDTQAFGGHPGSWDNPWDSSDDGVYGSALPQLYGEVGFGDLSVKFGHFYTIIGYEVVTAPDNFFTSYAYTMYFGEPFTHTGVLASYAVGENVTVYGGWTQGWDTGFDNTAGADTFLGGVSLTLTDDLTVTYATTWGDFGEDLGLGDIYMHSVVADLTLTDKLSYVFQSDVGVNSFDAAPDAEWYGVNQYLTYQWNDCWALGMRFEWFRDDDGARIPGVIAGDSYAGDFYEVTWGVNWRPHANIVVRPELRYDWYDGPAGAGGSLPFNGGAAADQFSGGFDVITTF